MAMNLATGISHVSLRPTNVSAINKNLGLEKPESSGSPGGKFSTWSPNGPANTLPDASPLPFRPPDTFEGIGGGAGAKDFSGIGGGETTQPKQEIGNQNYTVTPISYSGAEIARSDTPPNFSPLVDQAAGALNNATNFLKGGAAGTAALIRQSMKPDARNLENLIQLKSRLEATRNGLMNNAVDPLIGHLNYVLQHPANQSNPQLLARTREMLQQALQIKGSPEIATLNRQIREVKSFIQANKNIINNNPMLKTLNNLSNVLNVMGGVSAGVQSFNSSPESSTWLKTVNGLTSGAANYGLLAAGGLPVAVDNALLGGNASGALNNAADSATVFTQFLLGGRINGAESLVAKMQAGGNGPLVQAASRVNTAIESLGNPAAMARFAEASLNSSNPIISFGAHLGAGASMVGDSFKSFFGRLLGPR